MTSAYLRAASAQYLGVLCMVDFISRRFVAGIILLSTFSGLSSLPAQAELPSIGVPAAVRPDALGTPPGVDERILQVGIDLIAD